MASSLQDMKNFTIIDGELRGLVRFEKGQKWGPYPLTDCPSLEVTPDVMLTIGSKVYPKSLPSQCKNMRFLNLSPQATNANCCLHLTVGEFNHVTLEITSNAIESHEPLRSHLIVAFSSSSANMNGLGENGLSGNVNISLMFVTNKCPYCSVAFSKLETLEAHIRDYCATRRRITNAIMHDPHSTALSTQTKTLTVPSSKAVSNQPSTSSMSLSFVNGPSTTGATLGPLSNASTPAASVSIASPVSVPQETLPLSVTSVTTPLIHALLQSNAVNTLDWLKLLESQPVFSSSSHRSKAVSSTMASSNTPTTAVTTAATSQSLSPGNLSSAPSTTTPTVSTAATTTPAALANDLLKYCSDCDLFFTSNELYQWHLRLTPDYVNASIITTLNTSSPLEQSLQQASVLSSSSNGIVRLCTHNCGILEIPMHMSPTPSAPHLPVTSRKSVLTIPNNSPHVTPVNVAGINAASCSSSTTTSSGNIFPVTTNHSTPASAGGGGVMSHPLLPSMNLLSSPGASHTLPAHQQDQMLRILAAAARLNSTSFTNHRTQLHPSNGSGKRVTQTSRGHSNGVRESSSKSTNASDPSILDQQHLMNSEPHVFPEKKYPCPFCEASFSHPDNLRAHRRYYCVPLDPLEEGLNVVNGDEQLSDVSIRSSRTEEALILQQVMKLDAIASSSYSASKRQLTSATYSHEAITNQHSDADSDHQDIIDVVSTPQDKTVSSISFNNVSVSPENEEDRHPFGMKRMKLSPNIHH